MKKAGLLAIAVKLRRIPKRADNKKAGVGGAASAFHQEAFK
jgi:hypothetical protein